MTAISATDTGLPGLNRRRLLSAAPLAVLAGAMPAMAMSGTTETPIMALYRQWKAIHVQLNDANHGLSDDAWDALHAETWRICDRVMEMPATGGADVLAKMMVFTCEGDEGLPSHHRAESPQFWAEVHEVMGGAA